MSRYDNSEVENADTKDDDTSKSNRVEAILRRQGSYSRKNLVDFLRRHLPMLEPSKIHGLAGYLDAWYEASLQRQLQEAVNDLVDEDPEANTKPVESAEKEFKQAIKDNIKASKRLAEVGTDELYDILADMADNVFEELRDKHHATNSINEAKAALESIIKQKELEARIVELDLLEQAQNSKVYWKHGNFKIQDFKLARIKDLEKRLNAFKKGV